MKLQYIVNSNKYINVKQVLKEEFNMSDRLILKLKKNQNIRLNNEIVYVGKDVQINDVITIDIDFIEDNSNIVPNEISLDIIYEDDAMLILNKPAGIAVHPSMLHYNNSLSNGVKFYFDKIGLKKKIRPVNRIDKDTSRNCYFCKK